MKYLFDKVGAALILIILFLPILGVALIVRVTSKGSILYWSDRVGRDGKIFKMPKFRSMLTDTPAVATHLLDNPNVYLSPIGAHKSGLIGEYPNDIPNNLIPYI